MFSQFPLILTRDEFKYLALMPFTCGSRPPFWCEGMRVCHEHLESLGIITGAEGCFSVRWGLLSLFQYAAVVFWRRQDPSLNMALGRYWAK